MCLCVFVIRAALDAGPDETPESRYTTAHEVYTKAFKSLRESQPDAKEEAVMLLEAWRDFEAAQSTWR